MTVEQIEALIYGNRLEEIREEGREEERKKTVLNMLRDHLPLSSIVKYCELSMERITELAQSNGIAVVTG